MTQIPDVNRLLFPLKCRKQKVVPGFIPRDESASFLQNKAKREVYFQWHSTWFFESADS